MKKRANGEGTIYTTIQRNKRKEFLKEECTICKNCTSKCNRNNFERCDKCKNCTECLKYCDRYYCYKTTKAQITIQNKRQSAGTGKTTHEVKEKKELKTKELNIKSLIKNSDLTLSEAMRYIEKNKLDKTIINENSYNRNLCTIRLIENYNIAYKKLYELTSDEVEEFLSLLVKVNASQSYLNKVYNEIRQVARMCNMLSLFDNIDRNTFVSNLDVKEIQAFSIEEERILLKYLDENDNILVNNKKCNIDIITIKNLIKFALATAMRIGEICSLDKYKNIDMIKKRIIVKQTVTRDINNKSIIGEMTKTGRKKKQSGKEDKRYVPFGVLFDENEVEKIIKAQSDNSVSNLLFSSKDGKLIEHSSINEIFKRICKRAGINQDCNMHMTKHTGVTRMLESGMDIYAISKIVGTSVKVLTETYAHILDDFVDKEIEKSKKNRQVNDLKLENENKSDCKIISFALYK